MSLLATRLQNLRVSNPQLDRNMARACEFGALDFFVSQTDAPDSILGANLREKAFASMGNTVQVPVLNYDGEVTVANTRTCVITDDENTSALYEVTWVTYQVGFTMVPALYMNNEISYEQDFNRKVLKVSRALANALDTAAVAALEANKTQVYEDLLYYSETGDDIQVPWDMRNDILSDTNTLMRANCYPGQIHVIGNAGVDSMLRKQAQLGLYNEVNKRLEFEDKVVHFTNNIANEAGKFGTFFAVEAGNVGVLTRVDREALRRARINGHEWDVVRLPLVNLPVGSHYYTEVGDQSTIAGAASADLTCAGKEFFGFSVDVAFIVAYNSDPTTVANPIIKAEVASSASAVPTAMPVYVVNPTA